MRELAFDGAAILGLAAIAVAATYVIHGAGGGLIPRHNVYYGSDTDRVLTNLFDPNSRFDRLSVHPLFGALGVLVRAVAGRDTSLDVAVLAYYSLIAVTIASLTYIATRVWGGGRLAATAATVLTLGSGSFVFWIAVPETHVLGGASVLLLTILLRALPDDPAWRRLAVAGAFVVAISMVLTNVLSWGLGMLALAGWSVRSRPIRHLVTVGPQLASDTLAGIGLLALAWLVQYYALRNDSIPQLLQILSETRYVGAFPAPILGGAYAVSPLSPESPVAIAAGLGMLAVLGFCLRSLGPVPLALALFPLAGFILHTFYDRRHAFLFAPNYVPIAATFIALGLSQMRARWPLLVMAAVGVLLGAANLHDYSKVRSDIAVQSDPAAAYEIFRRPHPIPEKLDPMPADPPLGPEA
ncbi:hypothetical protein [Rubellimicrobium arenae]|nr:hypothetical protein [Rubellimicrobium arenae]